jgi:hypothetical protein
VRLCYLSVSLSIILCILCLTIDEDRHDKCNDSDDTATKSIKRKVDKSDTRSTRWVVTSRWLQRAHTCPTLAQSDDFPVVSRRTEYSLAQTERKSSIIEYLGG